MTHEELRDPGDAFKRSCIAIYMTHHLNLAGFFPKYETPFFDVKNGNVVTIITLVLRHLQSCSCNAYEINEFVHFANREVGDQSVELGGAIYPTISLSNHSCAPNTAR